MATFETMYADGATTVVLEYYAKLGDGGGGVFNKKTAPGCSSDNGVIVLSGGGQCYYRQFSGPVHLAWYGAADASASGCQANFSATGCTTSSTVIGNAFTAADPHTGLGGDGGVSTDGRAIYVPGASLTIPTNQYLTCDGPPGGQRQQKGGSDVVPYNTLPSSIILDFGGSAHHTITVSEHAALSSCIVRPSWYNGNLVSAIGSTRDIVDNIEHNLAGTCVTGGGTSVSLHDLFVIGCDTGVELNGAGLSVLANLNIEGNVGIYNHDAGDGVKLQNVNVQNFLEQFNNSSGNSIRESDCPITARLTGTVAVA